MIFGITGNTSGIGLDLSNSLETAGNTVINYSRTNGYDISDHFFRTMIAFECTDYDAFINNAWADGNQIWMFKEIKELWKHDETKTIINIGSRGSYAPKDYLEKNQYYSIKKELADHIHLCQLDPSIKCRIINISPGYVGSNDLTHKELSELIIWAISIPKHLEIGELLVYNRKSNDKFL